MLSWAGICLAGGNTKYYEGSRNWKRSNSKVTTKRNLGVLLTFPPGLLAGGVAKRILDFNNLSLYHPLFNLPYIKRYHIL